MSAARGPSTRSEAGAPHAPGAAATGPALTLRSGNADDTRRLGAAVGALLGVGDVVALCGPLGAGKTLLTQGIAAGLGVPPDEPVVSPTFVLARQYAGRVALFHLDAYRLSSVAELWGLGFEEMLAGGAVVVEWAERVAPAIPPNATWVELIHGNTPDERVIVLRSADAARWTTVARALATC